MKPLLFFLGLLFFASAFSQNVGLGTSNPSDQLHTTGTVRFENYKGATTRMVQLDTAGRMVVAGGSYFPNTTAQAIPDNGCAAGNGISSQINVSGQAAAVSSSKISVRINITHSYVSDLRIYLYPPTGGGVLVLASQNGGAGQNFTNTIFTDQATVSITAGVAPFTGQYRPKGGAAECFQSGTPLTGFAALGGGSIVPNGTWTLRILDNANIDAGTLNNWSISFAGPESFAAADMTDYIPKFSSGNLVASNIYQDNSGNIGIGSITPTAKLDINGNLKVTGFSTLIGNTGITGDLLVSKGVIVGNSTLTQNGTVRLNTANDNKFEYRENGVWNTLTKEFYNSPFQSFTSAVRNTLLLHPTYEYVVPASGWYLVTLEANSSPVLKTFCSLSYIDNSAAVSVYNKTIMQPYFSAGSFKWHLVTINSCLSGQSIPLRPTATRIIHLTKNEILTFAYQMDMFSVPPGALDNWSADAQMTLLKVGD